MHDRSASEKHQGRFPLVAGIYKKGLTAEERKAFCAALEPEIRRGDGMVWQVFTGENIWVAGAGFAGESEPGKSATGTGGCLLSFCDEQTGLKAGLDRVGERLNGTWSLVAVNDREGVLLGRDSAGAQSMYCLLKEDALVFGSSLTLFRNLDLEVDREAISEFLHYLYVPAPRTIYREVKSVLPGQIISFDGKSLKEASLPRKNYGEHQQVGPNFVDPEQLLLDYEDFLNKSVQISCSKKGKTALFLSGGKDSTALAIAVKRSGLQNVEAVTLGFDEKNIDETKDAQMVAEHLGLPFRQLKFSRETYLKYWPEFIRCFGQPVGDCAALPVFAGMKESDNRYEVFLDGTGNDGYLGHTTTWQEDLAWHIHRRIPGLHHLPWEFVPNGYSYSIDILARYLSKPREEQFVSWNGWTIKEIAKLTGIKPSWQKNPLYKSYRNCSSSMVYKTLTLSDIWAPETAYTKVVQIGNIMGKLVRFPFLDRGVVSFSQNLPSAYQYKGRVNKIILRLFLEKYMPEEIINKKKGYFIFPKNYILASNNYEFLDIFLSADCIRKYGWVDDSIVNLYVQRYKNGDKSVEDRIWALVLLHAWAEFGRG
ncbi:MAG: asparagine synthase [Desulfuromonadales bacterium]|nr:asparagine synthase [Desulfuromonadales bacterium]